RGCRHRHSLRPGGREGLRLVGSRCPVLLARRPPLEHGTRQRLPLALALFLLLLVAGGVPSSARAGDDGPSIYLFPPARPDTTPSAPEGTLIVRRAVNPVFRPAGPRRGTAAPRPAAPERIRSRVRAGVGAWTRIRCEHGRRPHPPRAHVRRHGPADLRSQRECATGNLGLA